MTTLYGVIGKPILHSKSPNLYAPILDSDEFYLRFAVDSCAEAISLASSLPIKGINVTAPFKEEAAALSKVNREAVSLTHAANALILNDTIEAENTDIDGVKGALKPFEVAGKRILVLGAGGAGAAAAHSARQLGAEVWISNRTEEKAKALADSCGGSVLSNFNELLKFDIVISTIPSTEPFASERIFESKPILLDAVYGKESWASAIAKKHQAPIIPGEQWLLEQAIASAAMLLGKTISGNEISKGLTTQKEKSPQRINLIGMMGGGKSSTGKILSEKLKLPFYDLDRVIEDQEKATVQDIFSQKGEKYFRVKETEILNSFQREEGVFAMGGGVVTAPENRQLLKDSSGISIWLWANSKTLEQRITGSARPLAGALTSLTQERLPFYAEVTDLFLSSDARTASECADRIAYEICETWKN